MNINLGINFEMASLAKALEARVQSRLSMINAKYQYLTAWGRINRLLYWGPYAEASPITPPKR